MLAAWCAMETTKMVHMVIFVLRLLRAICGVYIILSGFGLLFLAGWTTSLLTDPLLSLAIMLGLVGALVSVFFGLRWLINLVHKWKYGDVHPVLGRRRWAL